MISRRELFKTAGVASFAALIPGNLLASPETKEVKFRYCLNTSTVSGNKPGIEEYIRIASAAGYDGIELWVSDVREYLNKGNSPDALKRQIDDHGLSVENAIGFAPWLKEGIEGFEQMKEDMELMALTGCKRIAAPPAGIKPGEMPDLFVAGEKYKKLIELGRQTGVMPQLEFWGASGTLFHLGQAIMIAAVAADQDVHILADAFHMFRGNSDPLALKMLRGNVIEIFHMNDYPGSVPREQQEDSDRVYPGDGVAPLKMILRELAAMGGTKVLSLELFNTGYWMQDQLLVAQTGLQKMRSLVSAVLN
jgi:2-keto-myo-inositol isomerase